MHLSFLMLVRAVCVSVYVVRGECVYVCMIIISPYLLRHSLKIILAKPVCMCVRLRVISV